jgi:cysteine desulfurase / selenocysteine lyase
VTSSLASDNNHTTSPVNLPTSADYPLDRIVAEFPVLRQLTRNQKRLAYLDNGATTQKPQCVIDSMRIMYETAYGTVRRGVYQLSAEATAAFEGVRSQVATFINAPLEHNAPNSIVFTKGTTEAINLVASTFGRQHAKPGKNILITAMEHHANLVPWQQLCLQTGAKLHVLPITDTGELDLTQLYGLLTEDTVLFALTHISNVLGTINPLEQLIPLAHAKGVPVLVDGAQAAPHTVIDVQALDCDFYVFSGHKVYGPSGVGVLYGKAKHLNAMPPYQFGGDMVETVTFEHTTFNAPPSRFEAGTPPIVEVIGLGAALTYITDLGLPAIAAHEHALYQQAATALNEHFPSVHIIGQAPHKAAVLSFVMDDVHPHDIGSLLDDDGVAIRAGHHCAQPLMQRFGQPAMARASFGVYNTTADVEQFITALQRVQKLFA